MNRMMTSGNQTVDAMASVNISGNVTPTIWYQTIQRANGRPNMLAIAMLSDIVYWYRPTEIRDEQTGYTIGWQKKFQGEYLQKSYSNYEAMFGESRRTVKLAMDFLIELGVIRRILKNVKKGDMVFYNTMFIDLDIKRLLELTYPDQYPAEEDSSEEANTSDLIMENEQEAPSIWEVNAMDPDDRTSSHACREVVTPMLPPPDTDVRTSSHTCREVVTPMSPPPDTDVRTSSHTCKEVVTPMYPDGDMHVTTNTKNTTKNTTENTVETTTEITTQTTVSGMDGMESINPSISETDKTIKQMQADIASIRENIGYDWEMAHGDYRTRRRFQEMFNLMCDVICINEAYVNLGGARVPYFRVREKLLQITREHLVYVMDCMDKNSGSIGNIQAYTLKSIYNAPSSIDSYYAHEANHDLNYMG